MYLSAVGYLHVHVAERGDNPFQAPMVRLQYVRGGTTHVTKKLTQHYPFCIARDGKKGTLSQHFVTHVAPPLAVSPEGHQEVRNKGRDEKSGEAPSHQTYS